MRQGYDMRSREGFVINKAETILQIVGACCRNNLSFLNLYAGQKTWRNEHIYVVQNNALGLDTIFHLSSFFK